MITYARFASLTLPAFVAAVGMFGYMQLTAPSCPPLVDCPSSNRVVELVTPRGPVVATADETRAAFEKVYREAEWGTNQSGVGNSGTGSTLEATAHYRLYLETFMKKHGIKSVVDAGCGDWEFSQKIDWTGIDYKGFDIVAKLVEQNTAKFGKSNIQFFAGNIVEDDLPPADLLISKHVLQHLTNADVKKFVDKQLKKYKHVLLTNGVHATVLSGRNDDIKPGEYRELDITRPPFDVRGRKALTYWANGHMHQVVHVDNTKGR